MVELKGEIGAWREHCEGLEKENEEVRAENDRLTRLSARVEGTAKK